MGHRNTHRRLDKLRATFDQLLADNKSMAEKLRKRDEPLVQKVKRLEKDKESLMAQAIARERVLEKMQAELEK